MDPMEMRSRREVLLLGAAGAVGVLAGRIGAFAADAPAAKGEKGAAEGKDKKIPIALQLYSVRHECDKDKGKNLPVVLAAVAKMGYEGVEFAGYYGWDAKGLRKLLDDNGLKCAGSHIGFETMLGDQLAKTVEFHHAIGNKYLIAPGLGRKYTESAKAWTDTAKLFNEVAEKLRPHGMFTGYHNHSAEFKPVDGQVPWDIFFGNTVKEVVMQLDIGNAMGGGADVVAILKKYPGRTGTIHIKEFGGAKDAAVGEGKAPWKEILPLIGPGSGTQWYIIEHERDPATAMADVDRCVKNLRKMIAG